MRKLWQNLSVSKKLYIVVGVMGLLIAMELLTLLFAMNILSAVRAFVGGEGLWSKAQKDAGLSLQKYTRTGDEKYYEEFLGYIQVPLGDRLARTELEKPVPDTNAIYRGFTQGRIHHDDIDGLIKLVRRFHSIPHLANALEVWRQGDALMSTYISAAEDLRVAVRSKVKADIEIKLNRIDELNGQLTILEDKFSYTLGQGSRWLEWMLMITLLCAVLMIESTGLLLTISFSRTLSQGLTELNVAAQKIGQGDFEQRVQVRTGDELGQLAESINSMAAALAKNVGQRIRAETANETKSQFLANMSHEIRTPIGTIINFAEFLKDPNISENERAKFIDVIHKTGLNLTHLINDILDLSKVEAGHFEINKSVFSLSQLLGEIRTMLEPRCAERSIELVMRKEGRVPDMVSTDPLRLRQILLNVLGNAVKFTDSGRITLTYQADEKHISIQVSDTGCGIQPEKIPLLFQLFSQVDGSLTRKHAGTGLGLALSRRLARLLGGDVFLTQSQPGSGSTFMIVIEHGTPSTETLTKDAHKNSDSKAILNGHKALVVDDSEDNRFMVERILSKHGMRVSVAKNGAEGAKIAMSGQYDVIIMDIQMPVMDGYAAARELRTKGIDTPIIALTAHAMKEDQKKCLDAGCNGYLTKPVHVDTLVQTLAAYVGHKNNSH